jgi:hypothetical protein
MSSSYINQTIAAAGSVVPQPGAGIATAPAPGGVGVAISSTTGPHFGSTTAVYDLPSSSTDVAIEKGTVSIHGTGIANAKAFAIPINLLIEQSGSFGIAIEDKLASSCALVFGMSPGATLNSEGTAQIFFRNGPSNNTTIIYFGLTGFAGNSQADLQIGPGLTNEHLILGNSVNNLLGFYGYGQNGTAGPSPNGVTQQTVTGSRGGNAALASLLTALARLGLIVDGTTA